MTSSGTHGQCDDYVADGATLTNLPPDWCAEEIPYNHYYWRVKARDSVTGVESEWSAVDPFRATSADPYRC